MSHINKIILLEHMGSMSEEMKKCFLDETLFDQVIIETKNATTIRLCGVFNNKVVGEQVNTCTRTRVEWCPINFGSIEEEYKQKISDINNPSLLSQDEEFLKDENTETGIISDYKAMIQYKHRRLSESKMRTCLYKQKVVNMLNFTLQQLFRRDIVTKYTTQLELVESYINSCSSKDNAVNIANKDRTQVLGIVSKHIKEKKIIDFDKLEKLLLNFSD